VAQYDLRAVEALGVVKLDVLGNRALSVIEIATQLGGAAPEETWDAATRATLERARTVGCFQIETPPVRAVLARLPLRRLADLTAALALVRPGPASGEALEAYVRRARGEEPSRPPHPLLGGVLESTHGMLLFEEDVIAAIARVTGASLAGADALRARLVQAGDSSAEREALAREFTTAAATHGVGPADAQAVWRELERFAAYSFHKAHATSLARLAWRTAWLKTHRPAAFAAALLAHYGGAYPLRTIAAELARAGVVILPPHVNRSADGHMLEGGAVRLGLSTVARLSARTRVAILARRPFRTLADVLAIEPSRAEREALVLCGACDGLAPLAAEDYPIAHRELLRALRAGSPAAALSAFVPRGPAGPLAATYRALSRIQQELRLLGIHVSDHPLRALRGEAEAAGCVTIRDAAARGGFVRVAALVAATRRVVARGGRAMQFVTLEDETGMLESVLFPGAYAALEDPIRRPGPFLVRGEVSHGDGLPQLRVIDALPFHLRAAPYAARRG
jgi:DNA polymerase-3 subunit alpha/error-prone DNA polymerase